MKKQVFFLVITWFALLLFPKVFGQLPERPQQNIKKLNKFKTGITIGLNYATFTGSGTSRTDLSRRYGYLFGFYSIYYFDKSVSLETDFIFTQKGANQKGYYYDGDSIREAAWSYVLNYIEFAPMLVINFTTVHNAKPYFLMGPAVDFRMWSNVKTKIAGFPTKTEDLGEANKVELCLILGAGSHFKYKSIISKIEVRYTYGFDSLLPLGSESDIYNSALSVIMGTSFGNKSKQ